MENLKFEKRTTLPTTYSPNTVYFVPSSVDSSYLNIYLSDATGSSVKRIINKEDLDALQLNRLGYVILDRPSISPEDFNVASGFEKSWTVTSRSYLYNTTITHFEVDWGDNSGVEVFAASDDSATIRHTYNGVVGSTYTLKITALDSIGNRSPTREETITLVANQAPVINSITWSNPELYENGVYTVTIDASDPENNPLTYTVTCSNPGVTIANTAQPNVKQVTLPSVISDTPVIFTYQVSDGVSTTTQTENKVIKNGVGIMCVIANTTTNRDDYLQAITIDSNGNIYVAGYTYNNFNYDFYVAKLDNNLNLVKQITIANTTNNNQDYLQAIGIDSFGNIYIAGNTTGSSNLEFYIAKLDSDLNPIKQITIANTTRNRNDQLYGITTDSSGNIYVAGYTRNGANDDFYIAKLDNNLNPIKQITIANTTDNIHNQLYAITTDSNGNVYVAGNTWKGSNFNDFYIAKFDNDLNLIKQITIANTTNNNQNYLKAIAVDSSGIVYVAGYTTIGTYSDFYVAKFNFNIIPNGTINVIGPINYSIITQTWNVITQSWPATTQSWPATTQTWPAITQSWPATTQTWSAQISTFT